MQINLDKADLFLVSKALEYYYEITGIIPTKNEELRQRYRNSIVEINNYILNAHDNYKPIEYPKEIEQFMEYKQHYAMQEYEESRLLSQ